MQDRKPEPARFPRSFPRTELRSTGSVANVGEMPVHLATDGGWGTTECESDGTEAQSLRKSSANFLSLNDGKMMVGVHKQHDRGKPGCCTWMLNSSKKETTLRLWQELAVTYSTYSREFLKN